MTKYRDANWLKVAVKYIKAKRIAVLSDNTAWGRPIAEIFSNEAERLGCKPVLFSFFGEKEAKLNFNDIVKTTLDAKPDLVYFAIYWNKAHIITHKLRDRKKGSSGSVCTFGLKKDYTDSI